MSGRKDALHIMAVDCCEHITAALGHFPNAGLTSVAQKDLASIFESKDRIGLVVIGISKYLGRRLLISQLRRIYPDVPVLFLRREKMDDNGGAEQIRGEFMLGDQAHTDDFEIVRMLRRMLPFNSCKHVREGRKTDTAREVVRVITEKYADPELDLSNVARELVMSPQYISRILNQQFEVSFRQLLRQVRIEEAKRMLASRRFSVKEVAARVGFSDSRYFSKSFKELTGLNASKYLPRGEII